MKATIEGYGTIDFNPIDLDSNTFDLYCIAICNPDTDEVIEEEHYVTKSEFNTARNDVYGREVMDEQLVDGSCDVEWDGCQYECKALYHMAYVIDTE